MKREAIKGKDVYVSMSKWVRLFFGFLYKYCEEVYMDKERHSKTDS